MKKLLLLLCIILTITLGFAAVACANEVPPVTVTLNGTVVDCAAYGQEATIVDDRTLVPLRAIFEALGADIVWDDASRTVISVRGNDIVELTIGSNVLLKNKQNVEVDVPARIMNDRTMVPVRVIAESFGVKVDWKASTRTVILECDKNTFPVKPEIKSELSSKHLYGEFFYGMTMQKAWDSVGVDEGEKSIHACDGRTEIHIADSQGKYSNEDIRITGQNNCSLVRLFFEGEYLCEVTVYSDCSELENAVSVRDTVASCYGAPDEIRVIGDEDNERDSEYVWTDGVLEIVCRIERMSMTGTDGISKLGNVCILNIKAVTPEEDGSDSGENETEINPPAEKPDENEPDGNKTETGDREDGFDEENRQDKEELPDDDTSGVEDVDAAALRALEKYLDACNSFNLTRIAELTTDSEGIEKLGIENLGDALSYAGVTKQVLSSTMLMDTYRGNEAYKLLTDAVIDVVFEFAQDASKLLYYSAESVSFEKEDEIVFEVTHFVPDISAMEEVFASSFDKALKKAFSDGTVSFDMTQEEMMVPLARISAEELKEAFEKFLDKDSFIPSLTENVTVVRSRNGKWLVDLGKSETEFLKTVKNGGSGILELFGFVIEK